MRRRRYVWGGLLLLLIVGALLYSFLHFPLFQPVSGGRSSGTATAAPTASTGLAASPTAQANEPAGQLQLDTRIPLQTFKANGIFRAINAAFGSRFDFTAAPGTDNVLSGTDGVFHENAAQYIVGIAPAGKHVTSIFHWGKLNPSQGDSYVLNEQWRQGLDTTRWEGDASDGSGIHLSVDLIDSFLGEPGCVQIEQCAEAVKDDTLPLLLVGVTLQNSSAVTQSGSFLFGSDRATADPAACAAHTTPGGTTVNVLSYNPASDKTGGTLFLAGQQALWRCNMGVSDRVGLAESYRLAAGQTQTAYMLVGGWNASNSLFANQNMPPGCQQEMLYAAQEWPSEHAVIDFALDNLASGDDLLGRAQAMEDILIDNTTLTPAQRWVIGDTLRSYKSSSWLAGRQSCAGGGYDAAVYEGTFGYLTTVDVLHDYGYFEINRVPWFFRNALETVYQSALQDNFGTYFRHDQGIDVNSAGQCVVAGRGTPTLRSACAGVNTSIWGTEEDSDVALLTAYYVYTTHDLGLLTGGDFLVILNSAMLHNQSVGDPQTGIAYQGQDTGTTYDDQPDCLRNVAPNAGNLSYQGIKEAAAYRATAYLDELGHDAQDEATWLNDASQIEQALANEYTAHGGFIALAPDNSAFPNCSGRSIVIGEGLFYLHLIGLDGQVNQQLLRDLAAQYPADLQADTLTSPPIIVTESIRMHGGKCLNGTCGRVEWFSKAMLSSLVADLVYTKYGCTSCARIDVATEVYTFNAKFPGDYCDGIHDDYSDWIGYQYPRGLISWAFLNQAY
jgi:Glycosyl hydrolase family 52